MRLVISSRAAPYEDLPGGGARRCARFRSSAAGLHTRSAA